MFTYTCQQCGKEFKNVRRLPRIGKGTGIFCSNACYHESTIKNHRTCAFCGKTFIQHCKSKWDSYTHCSKECSENNAALKKAEKYIEKECAMCHKKFRVLKSIQNRYNHCSIECRRQFHKYEIKICSYCGKEFKARPLDIERGVIRSHCSRACYRRDRGETSIETMTREAIIATGIVFHQEYRVGAFNIDFAFLDKRIALEVDGIYWHKNPAKGIHRNYILEKLGWKVIHWSEKFIRQCPDLALEVSKLVID